MDTFGQRLVSAMYAAGIETPEQLSKICGVNGRTAIRYMVLEKADLSAEIAYKLARGLNVRLAWLISGEPPVTLTDEMVRMVRLMEGMSPAMTRRLLRSADRMADTGA